MALSRILYDVRAVTPKTVMLTGRFEGNGTSSPTNVQLFRVDSVTRTGTGVYTLTLPGKGSLTLLGAFATPSEDALIAEVSVNPSTRVATVSVFTQDTGALVATDVSASEYVNLLFFVKNGS